MKKYLYIILGIIGAAMIGYSVTQGWATFFFEMAGIQSEPLMATEFNLGIVTAVLGAIGVIVLFIKPKISIIPSLAASGTAAWFYLNPPMLEDLQYTASKMVIVAIVGGVILALGGLVAPKKG